MAPTASPADGKLQMVKHAPPPAELPVWQRADPREVSFFGRTTYEIAPDSKKAIFGIKRRDRKYPIYIIGKSGTGKSKLLELLARQDVFHGQGLAVIDPDGDLVTGVLDAVPEQRIDDVVLMDPAARQQPLAFNPLGNVPVQLRHQIAASLSEIVKKFLANEWSSALEHACQLACRAVLEEKGASLGKMLQFLTDHAYRQEVTQRSGDDAVRRFFAAGIPGESGQPLEQAILPLASTLERLLAIPSLRRILEGSGERLDLPEIIGGKKILLVNLAKEHLGEEGAAFLGALLMAEMRRTWLQRSPSGLEGREGFYLYIDDFPILAADFFEKVFTETQRHGFCLTVAHRYLGQLSDRLQSVVRGNAGTTIILRVSGEDAEKLESDLAPVFKAKDLVSLGTQQFAIKMTIDGEVYDPFSGETLRLLRPPFGSPRERIMERLRQRHTPDEQRLVPAP